MANNPSMTTLPAVIDGQGKVIPANGQAVEEVRPQLGSLAAALAVARAKCRAATKDATNTFHKYKYASAESILDEARTALLESGLALIPLTQELRTVPAGYEVRRRLVLAHSSGESVPVMLDWPIIPDKGRPLDKALAAAITTSLAYYLRDLLLMPRVDQSDNVDAREDREEAPPSPATTRPGAAPNPPTPPAAPATPPPEATITEQDAQELARLYAQHQRTKQDIDVILAMGGVKLLHRLPARCLPQARLLLAEGTAPEALRTRVHQALVQQQTNWEAFRARLQQAFGVSSLAHLTPAQLERVAARVLPDAATTANG